MYSWTEVFLHVWIRLCTVVCHCVCEFCTSAEYSQISSALSWAAVTELRSQRLKLLLSRLDLFYVLCTAYRNKGQVKYTDQNLYEPNPPSLISHLLWMSSRASSLVLVIFCSRQEDGRRDWLCFTRRWEQRTWGKEKNTGQCWNTQESILSYVSLILDWFKKYSLLFNSPDFKTNLWISMLWKISYSVLFKSMPHYKVTNPWLLIKLLRTWLQTYQ